MGGPPLSVPGAPASDMAPLLCRDRLAPAELARARLVCRSWRACIDKATTQLVVFAPPARGEPLAAALHAVSCVLPVRPDPDPRTLWAWGTGAVRPAAPRGGWVRQLSDALPALASLLLQCRVPGCQDDLAHLRRLPALRHLTLLDFPFDGGGSRGGRSSSGGGGGGSGGSSGGAALARTVGRCVRLCTLCLQDDRKPLVLSDLSALAPLTALTRLRLQPGELLDRPLDASDGAPLPPGVESLTALTALRHLAIVPSQRPITGTASNSWFAASPPLDGASSARLAAAVSCLGRLLTLELAGLQGVPRELSALTQLRSLSLSALAQLCHKSVAPLAALTALEALTLLSVSRPPPSAPPPFGALSELTALRRALLGCCQAWAAPAWAAGGPGALLGYQGEPPVAYLCPASWGDLAALQELRHISIEAHGWQSAGIVARFPTSQDAITAALQWSRRRAAAADGGACGSADSGSNGAVGAFAAFFNHPDDGIYLPAWPEAVAIGMWPSAGGLGPAAREALVTLLRRHRPGLAGPTSTARSDVPMRRLMLALHRGSALPSRLVPLLCGLTPVVRLELACDQHWPPQVLGAIGALTALPNLKALRVDASRSGAVPLDFWTGLGMLTQLQWLALGWFDEVRLGPITRLRALRALQLRGLTVAPSAARLAEALAPLRCLGYLSLEGARLDGAAAGPAGRAAARAGAAAAWLSPSAGDFVADACDIVAHGRRSRTWVLHALGPGATAHPLAVPLQRLSCLTATLMMAVLLQANLLPEAAATALLAASHLILLIAAAVFATAWLLLGLPEVWALPPLWGPLESIAALLPKQLRPATGKEGRLPPPDPRDAFQRLRFLSLRRCSLAESKTAVGSAASDGAGAGGLFTLLAASRHAASGAAGAEEGAATAGAAADAGARRRACAVGGAALLHWLLPHACAAAQTAGRALSALGLGPHPTPSAALLQASAGPAAAAVAAPAGPPSPSRHGTLRRQRGRRSQALQSNECPPQLAALLCACPELHFVDLTFVSGGPSAPSDMARLVSALRRAGNVRYLALTDPDRVPLGRIGGGNAAASGGYDSDTEDEEGAEEEGQGGWGRGGGGWGPLAPAWWWQWWSQWLWWLCAALLGGSGRRARGVGGGSGGVRHSRRAAAGRAEGRGEVGVSPPGPLLMECCGFDDVIARELGL